MSYLFYCFFSLYIVPSPIIGITASNTQIVGQSLTLECSLTTVRGITSRVDIVWSSDGVELKKSEGKTINSTTHNSVTYIDTYTILQLNTSNEGQQFHCEAIINGLSPVMDYESIILDVSGKITLALAHRFFYCMLYVYGTFTCIV